MICHKSIKRFRRLACPRRHILFCSPKNYYVTWVIKRFCSLAERSRIKPYHNPNPNHNLDVYGFAVEFGRAI